MTFRYRAAGALLALSIVLASCESIPPVSNRHRIYTKRSTESGGLLKHLAYNLKSEPVATPVRGPNFLVPTNRAFAIFDLSAHLTLVTNEGVGGVEGTQADGSLLATLDRGDVLTGESASLLDTSRVDGDLVGREDATDILTAENKSEIDRGKQEGRVDSTRERGEALHVKSASRFATAAAFEDYVRNRANFLRNYNTAIADLVEQDQVLRMIFQDSKEEFSERIGRKTITRDNLLEFTKSISVDEIVPGETFEYTLEVHNTALATITRITLYDEFPTHLHYERNFRLTLTRSDGTEESFDEESHPSFIQSVVTDDDWERGKICWAVVKDFLHGDTLKLSFDATFYESRGEPSKGGVPLYAGPTASEDEVVERLEQRDRVYLVEPIENFYRVFVRRPIEVEDEKGKTIMKLEKFDGFILAEHFREGFDGNASDRE